MKHFIRQITAYVIVFLILLMGIGCLQPAVSWSREGQRKQIRVGIPEADSVSDSGGESRVTAYEKDYLQALAEYADWEYIFVEVSWEECLAQLKDGKLDLLMYVTKTEEREKIFDYSSESMGTEMCCLIGPEDTELYYEDTQSFQGLRIGYEKGNMVLASLERYAERNGFTFQGVPYKTAAETLAALEKGEVDAVVQTSFYETPDKYVMLAKCDPRPVYIATSKRKPELKEEVDRAMTQLLSYNAGFNADLFEYYYGNIGTQTVKYTKEEMAYLETKPVVTVYYETNREPFEYEKDHKAVGMSPDIIREIGKDTGIQFRFVPTPSAEEKFQSTTGELNEVIMTVSYDYRWASSHGLLVTQPYLTGSAMRVMKKRGKSPKTVALVKKGYLEKRIMETYPELKCTEYETFRDCMEAVEKGDVDCTFLNYYQASYYRSTSKYEGLFYQPDKNINQGIGLGVTKKSNPALFGILSKSLQKLSTGSVQGIMNENMVATEPMTFNYLMRKYPGQMAVGLSILGIFVGLLGVFIKSSVNRKQQNQQLLSAKMEAETANMAKSEFLSRMSHDMRTPLNGIIGMGYLAREQDNPEKTQECLEKMDTSSRFLLSLINDVLDMTKAESGGITLHPEPYFPEEFKQYMEAVIRPLCKEKHQEFTMEISIPEGYAMVIDKLRINQIVFNLLSNAVKYTKEGGQISYRANSVLISGNRLATRILVKDNGIGMSQKFQKVLFDSFTQEGRDDSSEARGSGLGLAITKRLVELMGGTISVTSEVGKGSAFSVELVTDVVKESCKIDKEQVDKGEHKTGNLLSKHVLLCEDHPLNQELVRALLEKKGMVIAIAEDGQQGVNKFAASMVGYYDVILMDIRMPVLDGYGATMAIRKLERPDAKTVPILAMTADAFADDVEKCKKAGMDGHMAKPIDPNNLYRKLSEVFANRK